MRMGPIRCPETSVNNYHTTPHNTPEDRRFMKEVCQIKKPKIAAIVPLSDEVKQRNKFCLEKLNETDRRKSIQIMFKEIE